MEFSIRKFNCKYDNNVEIKVVNYIGDNEELKKCIVFIVIVLCCCVKLKKDK